MHGPRLRLRKHEYEVDLEDLTRAALAMQRIREIEHVLALDPNNAEALRSKARLDATLESAVEFAKGHTSHTHKVDQARSALRRRRWRRT